MTDTQGRHIEGRITGEVIKQMLRRLLENLIPRKNETCSKLKPWKRAYWVIELRLVDATPHIHATVWTDQAEDDLERRTCEQWVKLWTEIGVRVKSKDVHVQALYDVDGWLQYMLKRNGSGQKRAQQDLLRHLIGVGNVWGRRPASAFPKPVSESIELTDHQMFVARRILIKFEIRKLELMPANRVSKKRILSLKYALKRVSVNNGRLALGVSREQLKQERSRTCTITSFGFDQKLVKQVIEYIKST